MIDLAVCRPVCEALLAANILARVGAQLTGEAQNQYPERPSERRVA
jgi:hypothetical protein